MKKSLFILISLLIFSCSTTSKYVTTENKKLPGDMVKFLNEFELAATDHNSDKVI